LWRRSRRRGHPCGRAIGAARRDRRHHRAVSDSEGFSAANATGAAADRRRVPAPWLARAAPRSCAVWALFGRGLVTGGVISVVAALIRDGDGRVLLVRKHGTSAFMQPGGKRDAGENDVAA